MLPIIHLLVSFSKFSLFESIIFVAKPILVEGTSSPPSLTVVLDTYICINVCI